MTKSTWMITACCALLASCSPAGGDTESDLATVADAGTGKGDVSSQEQASAALSSAAGVVQGEATLSQQGDAIALKIEAAGLPAGRYGIHIHQTGDCSGEGFKSAGGHWNPTDAEHGLDNPKGAHWGDLPNLVVGSDGKGIVDYSLAGATLSGENGLLDADGAAVVLHQDADDLMTDPSGNSGARIACGVIQAKT